MTDDLIFKPLRVLIFDVDGVFTDNKMLVTDDGQFLRTMTTRDGYAIKRAVAADFQIGVITGGTSIGVEKRFRSIGVNHYFSGIFEKGHILKSLIEKESWTTNEILYIGDDIPDIDCIKMAGVGACPADAVKEVKAVCDFISPRKGGDDCVRDLIERILGSKGLW